MSIKKLLLALLLTANILHAENSIGIDINSKNVEILASYKLNALNYYTDGTTYAIEGSYLNADGNNLAALGILGQNTFQGIDGLSLAFGFKGVITDDFFALPLQVKASYLLPLNNRFPPTSLKTSIAYAPSVLSFRDAQSYSEFRLEVDMEVISNIHLFTGYRNIKTEYNAPTKTFNSRFYGGLKLSF